MELNNDFSDVEPQDVTLEPDNEPVQNAAEPPAADAAGDATPPDAGAQLSDDDAAVAAALQADERVSSLEAKIAALQAQLNAKAASSEPDHAFLTEDEFDSLLQDPAKLNAKHIEVYRKARADAQTTAAAQIQQQSAMQRAADQFYTDNPDLKPHSALVSRITSELMAKNSGASYDDLLPRVAKIARGIKKLPTPAAQTQSGAKNAARPPRLPTAGVSAGRYTPDKHDTVSSDIDDMLKVVAY